jgi:hypothetical protein
MDDDGWLNNGLPFLDHTFYNGKTGRENCRAILKQWYKRQECERRIDEAVKSMKEQP